MRLPIDTHLILVDVQMAIDDPKWGPRNNPDAELRIAELLAAWREAKAPVVHVRHDSTEAASPYRPGQPGNTFKACAMPSNGEAVVAKQTNSAFIGTELESLLEAAGATTLVIAGVLTHNSLEATVRHAGNLGFRVVVPEDACWAVDVTDTSGRRWPAEDVHQLSLAVMDGEYAEVTDTASVTAAIAAERWRKDKRATNRRVQ
ncbi:MAG: cysteine hydrolase family protein [Hyphomicrobiaceae bacterium]